MGADEWFLRVEARTNRHFSFPSTFPQDEDSLSATSVYLPPDFSKCGGTSGQRRLLISHITPAWNQYAHSLQQTHPQPETFAAWRKFTRCTIPDQSGDPSALTVLTLTFAHGYTDRFGRSEDVDYRFTMGVEDVTWKITGVCDILSEGCFAVSWG